jgi:XTP/dITP diphosphohydrolase
MTRLLIATTNPAKLAEYRLLLSELPLDVVSLRDVGITDTAEESGATFLDNALIKARFYFDRAHIATLADDGGLEVDALGGEPGVRSHRWIANSDNSDRALVEEVIRRMQGVDTPRRTARIRAVAALIFSDAGEIVERTAEAAIDGVIADRAWPEIRPGFPYRAVLMLPERKQYLAELGDHEEAQLSQRRIALMTLWPDLLRLARGAS